MDDAERNQVAGLWDRHLSREFPADLRGEEVNGVDLVMLEADAAGCIETWLGSSSSLDVPRIRILHALHDELERVLPTLSVTAERDYFAGLRDVVELTLTVQRGWA